MPRKGGNHSVVNHHTVANRKRLGVGNSAGYWGEINSSDKRMVDKGWHRFWALRGLAPPHDFDVRFGGAKTKDKENLIVDLREAE